LRAVVGIAALALAAAWFVPVLFSSDVYAYAAYGELVRVGADPYAHVQLARGNPIFEAAIWQWGNPPHVCVYGPLFIGIAAAMIAAFAHAGVLAQLDALRALASLALPVCAWLAYSSYSGGPANRLTAAAAIGLNPVAIWCAVEGHNDALALAFVLAGYALVRRGSILPAAVLIAASGLIKAFGIVAAFGFALRDRRAQIALGFALLATLSLCEPLLRGIVTHLAPTGRYAPEASLQGGMKSLVGLLVANDRVATAVAWLSAALVASVVGWRGIRLLQARSQEGWAWLAAAAWALVPNPYPWYGVWLVAAASLAPRTRIGIALVLLSLSAVLRYAPDAIGTPNAPLAVALGVAASLPFVTLIGNGSSTHRRRVCRTDVDARKRRASTSQESI
jgi:hypothetical protein